MLSAIHEVFSPELVERAAILISVFFVFSPAVQMVSVWKTQGRTLNLVNPPTLILMFLNSALWMSYGVFLPMPPCVASNVFGLALGTFYLAFCWTHVRAYQIVTPSWSRRTFMYTLGGSLAACIACMFASLSSENAGIVGNFAMCIGLCLFAAPLSVLAQVLKDRSSELLPPVQCLLQFLSCVLWLLVGLHQSATPIITCNIIGVLLGGVQLALIAVFPSARVDPKKD